MKLLNFLITTLYNIIYGKSYSYKGNGVAIHVLRLNGSLSIVNEGRMSNCRIKVIGNNNCITLDKHTNIKRCSILIKGNNCILDIKGGRIMIDTSLELLDSDTKIIVKSNTGFNKNRLVVAGIGNEINIGSDCIFAEHSEIWASDTHSILDIETNKRINRDKPIKIADKVWIGNRAMIMKGVNIGSNSVIAAGSIVTKDVQANSLEGGIPSKCLKNNIKWNINRL